MYSRIWTIPASKTTLALALSLALAAGAPAAALAHESAEKADPASTAVVPLHPDLGTHGYRIRTDAPLAQAYFDQGIRLAYAFNHAEALRSFRAAQRHDRNCAMCYWGEAFVLGPNINAGMDDDAGSPALAAVRRGLVLARAPRERALLAALKLRYSRAGGTDQDARNGAYADAMGAAAKRYPDDHEIATLFVDALMNTTPWNYWEADGVTPRGRIGEAIAAAEQVLDGNPNHPLAIHLYIHLTEASKHPERAESYADRLATLAPGAGHLVHMAFHVYNRVGRHVDALDVNKAAVIADERALETMALSAIYRNGYYPHNIHSAIASARLAGDAESALEYSAHLVGKIEADAAARIGWVQRILAVPYFTHAQFSPPQTVLAVVSPGNRFPYVLAMWHYARGVAHARLGDAAAATREIDAIARIDREGDFSMLNAWGVPVRDLLAIARHVVDGRIAQSTGDLQRAVAKFTIAAEIQDSLSYVEPSWWYYPVRQSLGATLVLDGRPGPAVKVLEQSLRNFPNNVHALYVLAKAREAAGDAIAAREASRRMAAASSTRSPVTLDAFALETL